jgi:transcriptional regulator with XRE-family HTH domain
MPWSQSQGRNWQGVRRQSIHTDAEGKLRKLGEAIRAARLQRGLSQEGLADAAGIDRSHVGKIEPGERNVSVLNVGRVVRGPEHLNRVPDGLGGPLKAQVEPGQLLQLTLAHVHARRAV